MYNDYFGFKEAPFSIAPDPRYLYLSDQHREALAHLIYGVGDHGGFILLTGEVGTGKTTVCRCLLQQLPPNVDVAFIVNPRQNSQELLQSICHELHIPIQSQDSGRELVDQLNRFLLDNHAKGRNTTLIIDEAQNLSSDVLEQLRLLTNLETNDKKLLQLLLLGQPELNDILANPELRQLSQRITARYHLTPLNINEVADYITHRLFVAGSRNPLFLPAAVKHIYKVTLGIPRLINVICDRSLLGAYATAAHQVTATIVDKAQQELQPAPPKRQIAIAQKSSSIHFLLSPLIRLLFLGSLAALIIAIGFYQYPKQGVFSNISTQKNSSKTATNDFSEAIAVAIGDIASQPGFDLRNGFESLLEAWELPIEPIDVLDGDLCQRYPLPDTHSCYSYDKDFDGLIQFNRPFLMQINTDFYVLVGIENDQAIFQAQNSVIKIPLQAVKSQWQGKAWWIADISPRFHLPLLPGAKGDQVTWLHQSLAKIYSLPQEATVLGSEILENSQWLRQDGSHSYLYSSFQYLQPKDIATFDEKLTDLVKRFQNDNQYVASGIVDLQTSLQLLDQLGDSLMLKKPLVIVSENKVSSSTESSSASSQASAE